MDFGKGYFYMLQTTLAEFKAEFDQFLLEFLENKIIESSKINPVAAQNIRLISQLVANGGKRLRPFLVFLGFGMHEKINETDKLEIFRVGASLELFHTFALIHDDLIDDSLVRRGLPTIEAEYQKIFAQNNSENKPENKFENQKSKSETLNFNPKSQEISKKNEINSRNISENLSQNNQENSNFVNQMARNAAILAGDFAHTLSDLLMNSVENSEVRELFYQMQFELVAGQLDDCFGVGMSDFRSLTKEKILNMLRAKSGNYSIQKPLLMGWKLANFKQIDNVKTKTKIEINSEKIGEKTLENFEDLCKNLEMENQTNYQKDENHNKNQFGKNIEDILAEIGEEIGLVFQLTDDILGVFGETFEMGKSSESDLRDGKKTLLIYKTWQNSNAKNREFIEKNLGQKLGDFQALRNLIIETRSLQNVQKMCQNLSQKAIFSIQKTFQNGNSNQQNNNFSDHFNSKAQINQTNPNLKSNSEFSNQKFDKNSTNSELNLEIIQTKTGKNIQQNSNLENFGDFKNQENYTQNDREKSFYTNLLLELISYLTTRKK